MSQRVNKQVLTLPAIETELHLREIGWKMLCADLVPCSDDTALEQRECVFNSIGVDGAVDVLFQAVVDREMVLGKFVSCYSSGIGFEVIGNDALDILADVLPDVL